jgi:two-component system, cell cycle response regulator DivK
MPLDIGLIKNRLAGLTVLVAEDDEDSMRIAVRFLTLAGAQIYSAVNGALALDAARTHLPSLIISDLHMPQMDGWQFCEALKADDATKHIPVIALTADFSSQTMENARRLGFVGFIRKPLDPHKFVDQLLEIVTTIPELARQLPATGT